MGKKVDEGVLGKRIGCSSESDISQTGLNSKAEGLVLSQVVYRTIESLKPNPCNTVFDSLKTKQQLEALYKDIDEARAILNPLIIMPDGTLVEGHSRLEVAKKLEEEGRGLGLLPTRTITTPLSNEEIKQRVYLGNLSRFEIDEDTRISLYAEIWPGYFCVSRKAGRKSDHDDTITASMLSERLGKSIPQIKRDAALYRKASEKVGGPPSVDAIKETRKQLNEERKQKVVKKAEVDNVQPDTQSFKDRETQLINDLRDNGKWDFSLEVGRFVDYAELLTCNNYNRFSVIVEYLVARIISVEREIKVSEEVRPLHL